MIFQIQEGQPQQTFFTGSTASWPEGLYLPAGSGFRGIIKNGATAVTLPYFRPQESVSDQYVKAVPGTIITLTF